MKLMNNSLLDFLHFYLLRKSVKRHNVKGFIDKNEAFFLFLVAANGPQKGYCVEIGSYFGYSTIFLAYGNKLKGREMVVAVDPHYGNPEHKIDDLNFNSYAQFTKNIKTFRLDGWIDVKVMTSEEASKNWKDEPIRFLWIDGNHEYEFVKLDYESWEPFLVQGGILAFHDANLSKGWPGPQRLVKEISERGDFTNFNYVHGIAWAQKLKDRVL